MSFARVITYAPGRTAALVADGVALLLDADPAGPVVSACRSACTERRGADELLRLLFDAGPPAFALAATEVGGLRLVVGGRGQVEFAGGVAPTITGADGSGWAQARLDTAPDVRLSLLDPAGPVDPASPLLPIEAGVVLAAALVVPGVTAGATTPAIPVAAPASPSPPVPPDDAPMVQAVACANNHLNAPFVVGACRVCGAPVPAQAPFLAPRPLLGVLVLASGETVPIDREILLGRAPFSVDADSPRLVALPSPNNDLSRTHVRVAVDGWLVQVTDLASTNGTVATMPGQQGVRLRPHDPYVLVPGTVINLADEALVRFEVPG